MISLFFIIIVGLIVGLILFLRLVLSPIPIGEEVDPRRRWRKRFRIALTLFLLLILTALLWGFFIEPNRLVLHQETIHIDNWPSELSGMRIAMLGDFHTDRRFINEQKLDQIVALTNAQNPDLIVLLGDYIQGGRSETSQRVDPEVTAAHLKNLKAPLGVYAILGNHDWWYNGERVRQAFENAGIPVLEDDVKELNWHAKSFWLAGLADLWTRPQHVAPTIAKTPAGATIIALTHNPDIFPTLPASVPL
ncbi:MAG TPA: metallophosphoesterase, partial [Pyrinomonadaceae bacterium]|nr:metallophosphoesterase [Pyrinomonadaceae bacterium]